MRGHASPDLGSEAEALLIMNGLAFESRVNANVVEIRRSCNFLSVFTCESDPLHREPQVEVAKGHVLGERFGQQ